MLGRRVSRRSFRLIPGLLMLLHAPLGAQQSRIEAHPVDPSAIPSEAASFTLARYDWGAEVTIRLRWYATLRDDCEAFDSVADPYGLQASPGSCIGLQYITAQVQDPPGETRAYEVRNLPLVRHIDVPLQGRRHARVRVHLASVFADADTSLNIPRGDVIVLHVGPDYLRVVDSTPRLPPPERVDADTSLVATSWSEGGVVPHYLRVVFRSGLDPATRDALLDQPGLEVTGARGRFVDLRVRGDADGCRLRDVMDFFDTKSVVMSVVPAGRACGNVELITACPAREGSDCGP